MPLSSMLPSIGLNSFPSLFPPSWRLNDTYAMVLLSFSMRSRRLSILFLLSITLSLWKLSGPDIVHVSFVLHQPSSMSEGVRVNSTHLEVQWATDLDHSGFLDTAGSSNDSIWLRPRSNPWLEALWQCPRIPNRFTGHVRLPSIVQNVSQHAPGLSETETRTFWNPTILALPYWSANQYLMVSRIVTNGEYQENVICEANFCSAGGVGRDGELACTAEDTAHVGVAGGLRCAHPPQVISLPPTPARHCAGKLAVYADIPGFHDPRIFYGGRGEPLMVANTQ